MMTLRYTLLSDGSSDRTLLPLLTWLLRENGVKIPIQSTWADLRRLRHPPRTLTNRIEWTIKLYPCDLLFVHRDAERQSPHLRRDEIYQAIKPLSLPPTVCVIPIRMQEAWLLVDEIAIRTAAGNPNGQMSLGLPRIAEIENIPDPKAVLNRLIREASGLHGYRLQRLEVQSWRITEFMEDFSQLRLLAAFQMLETDIAYAITSNSWRS